MNSNRVVGIIILFTVPFASFAQNRAFKLCQGDRKWGGITLQSYHVGTSYPGGIRIIKMHFNERYISTNEPKDTGYLTLRFMVNCDGDIGKIEVLGSSRDFRRIDFSNESVDQLKALLYDLGKWTPGKTSDGVPVDSQKYLTFILNNGSLIDIVPK